MKHSDCIEIALSDRDLMEIGRKAIQLAHEQAVDGRLNANQRLWMTIPVTIEIGHGPDRADGTPPQQLTPCDEGKPHHLWCFTVDGFSVCI